MYCAAQCGINELHDNRRCGPLMMLGVAERRIPSGRSSIQLTVYASVQACIEGMISCLLAVACRNTGTAINAEWQRCDLGTKLSLQITLAASC